MALRIEEDASRPLRKCRIAQHFRQIVDEDVALKLVDLGDLAAERRLQDDIRRRHDRLAGIRQPLLDEAPRSAVEIVRRAAIGRPRLVADDEDGMAGAAELDHELATPG